MHYQKRYLCDKQNSCNLLIIIKTLTTLTTLNMKSVIATLAFSLLVFFTAFANDTEPASASVATDNCFFWDPVEKVVFIDFEEINGYAKEIVIRNGKNKVVFSEQLWDKFELNGNIYEWDFSEEQFNTFKIEVYTYTKVLTMELHKNQPLMTH